MQNGHLTYEELERYTIQDDFSEEYLCFCEPVTAHLDECKICRKRMDTMLLISELIEGEKMPAALRMVKTEEELRRIIISLRMEMHAKEQRMLEVAKRMRLGMLMNISASKADFFRAKTVSRGKEEIQQSSVTLRYEKGRASVIVSCQEKTDATVIMVNNEDNNEPLIAKAEWNEEQQAAVAEFDIEQLADKYEIFVDIPKLM